MRRQILLTILGVATVGACRQPESSNTVRVSGHVEATEVQVAAEVGGRLLERRAAEGDRVASGDLVARIDTRDVELQLAGAKAERAAADAQLRLLQAGARAQDVNQARAQADAAIAETAGAAAEVKAAETDFQRFEALLRANAGSQKQRDDAQARVDVARERERAASERVRAAREALSRLEAGARREEVEAARARVSAVDAQIAALEKKLADANVVTPVGGIVTQTLAETGEMVAPGMPLLVVTDLDRAWVNLFVPEPLIPRLTLGQAATVLTDAGGRVPGTVTFISPQAEFTPRNVQTPDERSKLVYRIKVSVDNRDGTLKQGMPVDAELTLQASPEPRSGEGQS